jgi:plasmid segregation protein ParM
MSELIYVGEDDGHDSLKTCTGYDPETKLFECTSIKSLAMSGLHQIMSMDTNRSAAYTADGQDYTISGESALGRQIDTRFPGYPVSPLNRVLVNHALINAKLAGQNVALVTGLPVDQFYQNGQPNTKLITDKTENLLKPVISQNPNFKMARISSNMVISEGIAAFYDALINGDGSFNKEIELLIARRPITVIDLGGKTLDTATINEGAIGVYKDKSGTDQIGVLSVKSSVAEQIKARFNISNELPSKYVDEAFITKKYELFGKMEDVADIIDSACIQYVSDIQNAFIRKVGDASDIGAVIFVGGGTALLIQALGKSILETIYRGRIIIPDFPEYSNARGMWKAAKYMYHTHLIKHAEKFNLAA